MSSKYSYGPSGSQKVYVPYLVLVAQNLSNKFENFSEYKSIKIFYTYNYTVRV